VVVLAMVPPLQFRNWQWACLALASPVAVWGAWPFHRAALTACACAASGPRPPNRYDRNESVISARTG
jgi:cation transport ATPase